MTGRQVQNDKIAAKFSRRSRQIVAICKKRRVVGRDWCVRILNKLITTALRQILFVPLLKSHSTKYCIGQSDQHTSCGNFFSGRKILLPSPDLPPNNYNLSGMDIANTLYCLDRSIRCSPGHTVFISNLFTNKKSVSGFYRIIKKLV